MAEPVSDAEGLRGPGAIGGALGRHKVNSSLGSEFQVFASGKLILLDPSGSFQSMVVSP